MYTNIIVNKYNSVIMSSIKSEMYNEIYYIIF